MSNEKDDVNILILGETGVGKSTWINGIANYARHDSLKDAMTDPELTFQEYFSGVLVHVC